MTISGITAVIEKDEQETVTKQIISGLGGDIVKAVANHFVVVLEAGTREEMNNKFEALRDMPGVISVSMAYYHEEEFLHEV